MSEQTLKSTRCLTKLAQQSSAAPADEAFAAVNCKRREKRRRDHRLALLKTANGDDIPCVITEISENGARIRLKAIAVLPPFVIMKDSNGGAPRQARVAWQRDNSAGLSFRLDQRATFAAIRPR